MTFALSRPFRYLTPVALLVLTLGLAVTFPLPVRAQEEEPIAVIGHGAFFDQQGRQIVPTAAWVERTQQWYRDRLAAQVRQEQKGEFDAFERRLNALDAEGQARLVVRQRALEWLVARLPGTVENGRMSAKIRLIGSRLRWRLPRSDQDLERMRELEPFELDPRIVEQLDKPEFRVGGGIARLVTTNRGQAYIDECTSNDVPVPPSINVLNPPNSPGWRSIGFIPQNQQFIVGTPAEMRVFDNSDGMCIALPRYTGSSLANVQLDGVICLSRITSRVCFWDNQWDHDSNPATPPDDFVFGAGTVIPIGVPDTTINPAGRYQAGGAEIEFGPGGVCTDCHAGENPYIIHPQAMLQTSGGASTGTRMGQLASAPLNLPMFAPNRYDPIVGASWPQNNQSHSPALVPAACTGCHAQGGSGGRLPHLASEISGYCRQVLSPALDGINLATLMTMPATMPQFAEGTLSNDPTVNTFQDWCGSSASAGPSNRGDPHLTTANGTNYDFQAAGEFVSLRNSSNGFELQTRQTPVLTSFTPGANAYTGLASCVSLNTAAALRIGRHKISYQPTPGRRASPEDMQLRIDGRQVRLTRRGVNLGGGNRIGTVTSGNGLDIRLDDGTRVIITPNYWASEGYWYLNVEVLNSPAREGTMGTILPGNWLPLSPTGSSFGPAPGGTAARHNLLNRVFADAWRVRPGSSLFDYAAGESTATFTERSWPPPPGSTCTRIRGNPWPGGQPRRPVQPMDVKAAQRLCRPIEDPAARDNCVFDLTATGEAGMAEAYRRTLMLRGTP